MIVAQVTAISRRALRRRIAARTSSADDLRRAPPLDPQSGGKAPGPSPADQFMRYDSTRKSEATYPVYSITNGFNDRSPAAKNLTEF